MTLSKSNGCQSDTVGRALLWVSVRILGVCVNSLVHALEGRVYSYDTGGQELNSARRKVRRHGTELGRVLGLLAPARGLDGDRDGDLEQVAFRSRSQKGSNRGTGRKTRVRDAVRLRWERQ